MDAFGIGVALKGCANIYFRSARCSGRTTAMLDGAKDGDRFVFSQARMANDFQQKLMNKGIKAQCVVIPIVEVDRLFNRGPSEGRTIFDHVWIEDYYMKMLDRTATEIKEFQARTSGNFEQPFGIRDKEADDRWRY